MDKTLYGVLPCLHPHDENVAMNVSKWSDGMGMGTSEISLKTSHTRSIKIGTFYGQFKNRKHFKSGSVQCKPYTRKSSILFSI